MTLKETIKKRKAAVGRRNIRQAQAMRLAIQNAKRDALSRYPGASVFKTQSGKYRVVDPLGHVIAESDRPGKAWLLAMESAPPDRAPFKTEDLHAEVCEKDGTVVTVDGDGIVHLPRGQKADIWPYGDGFMAVKIGHVEILVRRTD